MSLDLFFDWVILELDLSMIYIVWVGKGVLILLVGVSVPQLSVDVQGVVVGEEWFCLFEVINHTRKPSSVIFCGHLDLAMRNQTQPVFKILNCLGSCITLEQSWPLGHIILTLEANLIR